MTTFEIKRRTHKVDATIGELLIDGKVVCSVLEPAPDDDEGHPRIPSGTYELRLRKVGGSRFDRGLRPYAKRFGKMYAGMIEIVVPGRTDIEYHVGNFGHDTLGCVMPGLQEHTDKVGAPWVSSSEEAFKNTYPAFRDAVKAGPAFITVGGDEPPAATQGEDDAAARTGV